MSSHLWSAAVSLIPAVGAALVSVSACQSEPPPLAADQSLVPSGIYRLGSDPEERRLGYELSPRAVSEGHWYDAWESAPRHVDVRQFAIDRTPVTQSEYAEFVGATGHRSPAIDSAAYASQGFLVHPYVEVRPFVWSGGSPPDGLDDHPIVLVSHEDASAYCAWKGGEEGRRLRLPTESEWESACRGVPVRTFPWGNEWRDGFAQIEAAGTSSVWAHPDGATPGGVLDMAGNVFEWTASAMPNGNPALRSCSWDDAPGTCRCAFRHGRPAESRHILIGFRCVEGR